LKTPTNAASIPAYAGTTTRCALCTILLGNVCGAKDSCSRNRSYNVLARSGGFPVRSIAEVISVAEAKAARSEFDLVTRIQRKHLDCCIAQGFDVLLRRAGVQRM
jgi:hypothetical protein